MDATTDIENKGLTPKEGDFSVCLYCGELYVFKPDLTVRKANLKENIEFSKDPGAPVIIKIRKQYAETKKNQ